MELYEWLLKMYAKQGDKILDTHLGSGTIAIACYNAGLSLTACEISETYFLKSLEKISGIVSENSIQKNSEDAFSIVFPNQLNPENEKHNEYKAQILQLKLFNESKAKYNLVKIKNTKVQLVTASKQ
ncbi:DNA methyltransferase [Flavobacterium psychrophilum]|uniref:DNA methyltransferase n=1 Tax=Flavobacterium psychrophilum TaxID=96345 RepID=UPI003984F960